ncbi:O-antigen ligase [uncultured Brevundimonas sp.]|uniref:O-antigen ligase family protein n=1 Tax=uncultured Brevundimonas sp. TaxID=213418 RepID=UPI0026157658|nr:O-antigen ligase family protein [uncultured Brevundimonas sp.]
MMLAAPLPVDANHDLSAKLCGWALAGLLLIVIVGLGPLQAQKTMLSTGDGNIFRQALYILVFGFVIVSAKALQTPRIFLSPPLTLWVLIAWCWISLSWSLEPSIAFRRLLLTTIIIWTVFMIVERTGYERAVRTALLTLLAVLLINYVMVVLFPHAGIHQAREVLDAGLVGDWKGALPQKNFAGAVCAITILLLIFAGGWLQPYLRLISIIATVFFLYKTGSKTSLALTFGSLFLGGLYLSYDPKFRALLIPATVIAVGLAVVFGQFYWMDAIYTLSQGSALTGRGTIWGVLISYANDHWLLGTGYGSFWNIGVNSPVYYYTSTWVRLLGAGHNGYLDILVTVGVIGLLLTVLAFVVAPLSRLLWSRSISRRSGALLISMLIFCIGHNFTESSVMDRDAIVQVFFMMTLALITISTRRPPEAPGPLYFAWTGRFRPRNDSQLAPRQDGESKA